MTRLFRISGIVIQRSKRETDFKSHNEARLSRPQLYIEEYIRGPNIGEAHCSPRQLLFTIDHHISVWNDRVRFSWKSNGTIKMKTRPKVYVTRQIPQAAIDVLLRSCNISQWTSDEAVPRGELRNNVQNADCLLCMPTDKIDKYILNCAGKFLLDIQSW